MKSSEVEEGKRESKLLESQRRNLFFSFFSLGMPALSFSLFCSTHLEAKHPELVRGGIQLRVQRRPLLLLVEVLLLVVVLVGVVQGRGRRRRRGLERKFFPVKKEVSKKQKQRKTMQALFPIRALQALVPFLSPLMRKNTSSSRRSRKKKRAKSAGRRGAMGEGKEKKELGARRRQTNLAPLGKLSLSLSLSFSSSFQKKRTHAPPPPFPFPPPPLAFHAEEEYGELYPCIVFRR